MAILPSEIELGLIPLTDPKMLAIKMLIKRHPEYRRAPGLYPLLTDTIEAHKNDLQGQALDALLTRLGQLPQLIVAISGDDGDFSSLENWESVALDMLNVLYDWEAIIINAGPTVIGIAQRSIVAQGLVCPRCFGPVPCYCRGWQLPDGSSYP